MGGGWVKGMVITGFRYHAPTRASPAAPLVMVLWKWSRSIPASFWANGLGAR